jgi:hypothetical protein
MWMRCVVPLLFSALLMGCSPSYNWRTVSMAGGVVETALPDKPVTKSRTLKFKGHDITLTFMLAQVQNALFAVGYAPIPAELRKDDALRTELGQQVMASFYQGLHLPVPGRLPAFGTPFALQSPGKKKPVRVQATVWVTGQALVEAMVMSDAADFPTKPAQQFLSSTKVRQQRAAAPD